MVCKLHSSIVGTAEITSLPIYNKIYFSDAKELIQNHHIKLNVCCFGLKQHANKHFWNVTYISTLCRKKYEIYLSPFLPPPHMINEPVLLNISTPFHSLYPCF